MNKQKLYRRLDVVASILVFVGGLNWLFSVFNFNLVDAIFSFLPFLVKVVNVLVGLSALYFGIRLITKKFMK